ncbi:MAG TPA: dolichyl-phosphate beta-glucosyltransferase [Vicinamibacterales bacterium]|nr:dolichyl-phosphate beta-glucosyltransferase [Vicinamibacterales bacterium]
MAAPVHLSIVIPAYNEETRLPATLEELRGFLAGSPWTWEIRIVDDGSRDRTADVASDAARSEPRIVVQREPHRGKGGAVKAGMLTAPGAYRFLCDADLSMPVFELPRFLPPKMTDDIAIGTREGLGARRVGEPLVRHLAGRAFNLLVQSLAVSGIEDTQCGFKMFTARAAEVIFPRVSVDGWAFDIEVLWIARERGFTVAQIPIEWHYHRESRLDLVRDGLGMLKDVLRIRARARRGEYK